MRPAGFYTGPTSSLNAKVEEPLTAAQPDIRTEEGKAECQEKTYWNATMLPGKMVSESVTVDDLKIASQEHTIEICVDGI